MIFKAILFFHITVGTLSLITFWIPVFTKKGGNIHVRVGKAYVLLMWMVVISAALLCMLRTIQGHYLIASFLGFLALITAEPLWYAIVILKHKKDVPLSVLKIRKVLLTSTVVIGAALVVWSLILGLQGQAILLLIFGCLGLTNIPLALKSYEQANESANWLMDHIEGMIGTGIAAYTAFLAFGGSRFLSDIFSGPLMAIPWIIPTIVGVITIKVMKKKMAKQTVAV